MFSPEKILHGEPERLALAYRDGKTVAALGVCPFGRAALTAMAARAAWEAGDDRPLLAVAGDFYLARALYDDLKCMLDGVVLLPARDDAPVFRDALSGENVLARLKALYDIATGRAKVVVCSAEAYIQIFPGGESYRSKCARIEKGKSYDLGELTKKLTAAGYRREPQLTDVGRFALRGDILDVWSPGESKPARIEFFGDEADDIRYFDADDQLSGEHIESYGIAPATEFFADADEAETIAAAIEKSAAVGSSDAAVRMRTLAGDLSARVRGGDRSVALGYILPLGESGSIYDFCEFGGTMYDDIKTVAGNADMHVTEHNARCAAAIARGDALPFITGSVLDPRALNSRPGRKLGFQSIVNSNAIFAPEAVFSFRTTELTAYRNDFREMIADIGSWTSRGYTVYVSAPEDVNREAMKGMLADGDVVYTVGYGEGGVRLLSDAVGRGGVFHAEKAVVIGLNETVRKDPHKKIRRRKSDVFSAPEPGDYVVHELHGVGKFEGAVKLEMNGVRRDYLLVTYAGGDKLYVPVESMDCLSKYVSDGGEPKLNKIGGADFARVKEKVKKHVRELAIDLAKLYGERMETKGHRYSSDDSLLDEFCSSFEFTETDDQLTATEECLADLKSGKIMDRLLCGDVGYGKTEVALRVAFKVIAEGKQVAFLSPTTILARQHYETVLRRMEPFGVRAVRLTRFDSPASISASVAELKTGKADIAVGTHRLLGKDVDFSDLGLLILDEEQRFGVADKEKIKDLKRGVNVLTLSATPIPRTLHMSLTGIRDISVLDTPPTERIPVQTYVAEYGETLVVDAILREISRGGQAFVVYNRVSDIATYAARLAALMPSVRIAYAHGQMREDVLERTVTDFFDGKSDVLVSSTIIENGIDVARANTMIVVDADRLGLAQLYQLRGRVGRSNRLAYVFFTYDGGKILSDAAYKRLEAITQFTEFGSGFRIAMRDLEIRGAGTVLGAEQHGHMEKVGYDMYCKLLREAVGELSGEKNEVRSEVRATVDYGVFVPETYVPDRDWRLRVYSRIAGVETLAERDSLLSDLGDVYGPVPAPVKNLIDLALMKNLASRINATTLTLKSGENRVGFKRIADMGEAVANAIGECDGTLLAAEAAIKFSTPAKLFKFLLKCRPSSGSND